MRINVYHEELTSEFVFVEKHIEETDKTYYGFRMFLKSHPDVHHTPIDDDRTAITLWFGTKEAATDFLSRAALVSSGIEPATAEKIAEAIRDGAVYIK